MGKVRPYERKKQGEQSRGKETRKQKWTVGLGKAQHQAVEIVIQQKRITVME